MLLLSIVNEFYESVNYLTDSIHFLECQIVERNEVIIVIIINGSS